MSQSQSQSNFNERKQYVLERVLFLVEHLFQKPVFVDQISSRITLGVFESTRRVLQEVYSLNIYDAIKEQFDRDRSIALIFVPKIFEGEDLLYDVELPNEQEFLRRLGLTLVNGKFVGNTHYITLTASYYARKFIDMYTKKRNFQEGAKTDFELFCRPEFKIYVDYNKWQFTNSWMTILARTTSVENKLYCMNECLLPLFKEINKHIDIPLLQHVLSKAYPGPNLVLESQYTLKDVLFRSAILKTWTFVLLY